MIDLKDFVLRENDIERNGHIYCKECGKRVDGDLIEFGFSSFIPRIKCEYEIKRDKENAERERLMRISSLKRACFSSPIQHQYKFERFLANTKGDGEKAGEDLWVKAEKLYYTALIGYIYYEAP